MMKPLEYKTIELEYKPVNARVAARVILEQLVPHATIATQILNKI